MGIEIPGALEWVAKYVVGAGDWPDGDETAMRRAADGWTQFGSALTDIDDDAQKVIRTALSAIDGPINDAMGENWNKVAGKGGAMPGLIEGSKSLAKTLEDGANDIEKTKFVILAALAIFAAEMVAAAATAATVVGAPAAAAAEVAAQATARVTVTTAIKQLLARMMTRAALQTAAREALVEAVKSGLQEGGIELGAQLIQVAKGDRDEVDAKSVSKTAVTGAADGAIGSVLGGDGSTRAAASESVGDRVGDRVGDALGDSAVGTAGARASAGVSEFVTQTTLDTGVEVVNGVATSAAQGGIEAAYGGEFKMDFGLNTITDAAISNGINNLGGAASDDGSSTDAPDNNSPATEPASVPQPPDSTPPYDFTDPANNANPFEMPEWLSTRAQ